MRGIPFIQVPTTFACPR
ncbi:hypothetical protein RCO48_31860 [Peribacillus frigoritolerans]|nr:hypothetical protein [Peribacillus frigoritolerans]